MRVTPAGTVKVCSAPVGAKVVLAACVDAALAALTVTATANPASAVPPRCRLPLRFNMDRLPFVG
jgi:hypothetical protein